MHDLQGAMARSTISTDFRRWHSFRRRFVTKGRVLLTQAIGGPGGSPGGGRTSYRSGNLFPRH